MRKLPLLTLISIVCTVARAQSLDDIRANISTNSYATAKQKIDEFLSDPANTGNYKGWYYKGIVYTELYKEDKDNSIKYDASAEAFNAFKKNQQLDPKDIMMVLDQHVGYFQLYDANYNKGIAAYNAKNYSLAFNKMKAATEIEEYLFAKKYSYNGFSFPVLDTQLVNLTASSAYLAKREDEAIPYFKKLADAGLSSPDYKETYALLAEYYQRKNDAANSEKYVGLGRKLFPGDDFWISIEFGDPGKDTLVRFQRYEQLTKKYPANYSLAMDYAIENFNYAYTYDKKPADYAARQQKFESAMAKVFSIESTPMANYVMTKHESNVIYDLEDEIRATTDIAKRKTLSARLNTGYEELKKYAQAGFDMYAAQTNLKTSDKLNYRQMAEALADYYDFKKDAAKAEEYRTIIKVL